MEQQRDMVIDAAVAERFNRAAPRRLPVLKGALLLIALAFAGILALVLLIPLALLALFVAFGLVLYVRVRCLLTGRAPDGRSNVRVVRKAGAA